jgi:hypothetical protein
VDLSKITRHLIQLAGKRGDFELVPLSESNIATVIILCGCPRACGDKKEVRAGAVWSLVIAGGSVRGKPIPEKSLPTAVERELVEILEHLTAGAKKR